MNQFSLFCFYKIQSEEVQANSPLSTADNVYVGLSESLELKYSHSRDELLRTSLLIELRGYGSFAVFISVFISV